MRLLIIAVAAMMLSGCASRQQLAANDDAKCQSYGFTPGRAGYPECRMNLDLSRQPARQQADAVAPGLADGFVNAQQVYASPPPINAPQSALTPSIIPSCAEGYRCQGRTQQTDGTWR